MITVAPVDFHDPRAQSLWDEQQAELERIYGSPDIHPELEPTGLIASLIALTDAGEPVGTVLARWSHYHPDQPGTAEVKRLYVSPSHRGRRHARALMVALERHIADAGATSIVLETGTLQPEAIAVYTALDYTRMPNFGPYAHEQDSYCMTKHVPTRVLVINGTMGAGKTTTAAAVHDLLTERGARSAFIDGDHLCQATPGPAGDPFNVDLFFANLAAIAPVYRARGYGCVVIARVVEDAADRERYSLAFASEGGPAIVAIARVTASAEARERRLTAREPEGYWRDLALARTVELHGILERLALDDAVVSTDDADRLGVAAQVLSAVGWSK